MGSHQCTKCEEPLHQNQAYGEFQLIKQGRLSYAKIQKRIQYSEGIQLQLHKDLTLRKQLRSPHLVSLQEYEIINNSHEFDIIMYYQYHPMTLQTKLKQYHLNNEQFLQPQLNSLITGVQKSLKLLSQTNILHCCINPQTILYSSHLYKLTDVSSTTYIKSYDLVRRGDRNQFLSQRLLTYLLSKALEPTYELQDDLFSLGMLVLMIVAKLKPKDFYLWNQKTVTAKIRGEVIESAISKMQRYYSSRLTNKVKGLVECGIRQQSCNLRDELMDIGESIDSVLTRCQQKLQHKKTPRTTMDRSLVRNQLQ